LTQHMRRFKFEIQTDFSYSQWQVTNQPQPAANKQKESDKRMI